MKRFLISSLGVWLVAGSCFSQPVEPAPRGTATNSLAVQIWLPPTDRNLQAPATVRLDAYVTQAIPARAGDVVQVEFFANANELGSAKAVWHDAIRPQMRPGQAIPMFIIAPGYSPASFVWTNVTAGDYSLTARAGGTNSVSAVSLPAKLTVRP